MTTDTAKARAIWAYVDDLLTKGLSATETALLVTGYAQGWEACAAATPSPSPSSTDAPHPSTPTVDDPPPHQPTASAPHPHSYPLSHDGQQHRVGCLRTETHTAPDRCMVIYYQ